MGAVYATMTVTDDSDNEIVLDIQGYYNPTENGGWDSPSWEAYIDDVSATYPDGTMYRLSKPEESLAEEALWEVVEMKHESDMDDYLESVDEYNIRRAEMEYEDRMYK